MSASAVYPDGTRDFAAQVHGGGYVHSEHISNDRALDLIRTHAPDNLRQWGKMHRGIIYRAPPNAMGSKTDITRDKFKQLANSPLLVSASLLHEHNLNQRSGGKIFDAEYNEAEEAVYVSFSLDLGTSEGQFLDGFIKGLEKDGKRAELSLSHILHPDTGDVIPLEVSLCEAGAREGTVLLAQASKASLRGSSKGSYLVRASKNAFATDHVDLSSVVSVAPVRDAEAAAQASGVPVPEQAQAGPSVVANAVAAAEQVQGGESVVVPLGAEAPTSVASLPPSSVASETTAPANVTVQGAQVAAASPTPVTPSLPADASRSGPTAADMASAAAYSAMFFQHLRNPSHMTESRQVAPDDGLGRVVSAHQEASSMSSVRQMTAAAPSASAMTGRAPMDIEAPMQSQMQVVQGMYGTVSTAPASQLAHPVAPATPVDQMATAPPQVTAPAAPQLANSTPQQDAPMDTSAAVTPPVAVDAKTLTGNAHPRDAAAPQAAGDDSAERGAKRAARPTEAEVTMAAQLIGDIIGRANSAAAAAAAASTQDGNKTGASAMDVTGQSGVPVQSPPAAAPADDSRLRALEEKLLAIEAENRKLVDQQRQVEARRSQQETEERTRRAAHTKQLIMASVADKKLASQLAGMMDDPGFLTSPQGQALLVSASHSAVHTYQPPQTPAARPSLPTFSVPSATGASYAHQLPMPPAQAPQPYVSMASGNAAATIAPLVHQNALLIQASRSSGMGSQPLSILGRPLCDVQAGVKAYVEILARKHASQFEEACREHNFEPHIIEHGAAMPPPRRGAYIIQASRRASEHTSHQSLVERQMAASMTAILSAVYKATKVAGETMGGRETSPGVFMPMFTTSAPEMPEV